jgi:hypothetical protein
MGCGMRAQRIGMLAAAIAMVASGWYVFVYLYRWEWNRALISGVIFLAAEIGLLGAALLDRLRSLDARLDRLEPDRRHVDDRILRRLREHEPEPARPFAWLGRQQTGVFVPVLLGAGVVLSGLAWIVDRVARLTAGPTIERGLARRLSALRPPAGGLLGEGATNPYEPR